MKTAISIDQIEKWRLQIINLQDKGRHNEIKPLWENILKIQNEMDINNPNELEAIVIFFDDKTIYLLNS